MNHTSPLPLMMILGYMAIVAWLSYKAASTAKKKKSNQTFEDFYTAGKSMNGFVIALITIVTFYSGTTFTGRVGFFYNYGVVSLSTVFSCSTVGVIMFFLSEKIWPISKKYRLSTLSDMLELRYQSKWIKTITSVTICCFNIVWLITEIRTLGMAMNMATGGLLSIKMGSIVAFAVIILYVTTGGVRSVASVDSFSAMTMLFGSVIVLIYLVCHFFDGNIFEMFRIGAEARPELMTINSNNEYNMTYWVSNVLLATIAMLVYPSNYMSICLAKDVRSIKKSSIATALSGPWLSIYGVIGIAAVAFVAKGYTINAPETAMLEMLGEGGNALMIGLATTFIFAASLGTLDSTLISLSGLLSNDVITNAKRIRHHEPCIGELGDNADIIHERVTKNGKKEIMITRVIVVVLGTTALILSMNELPLLVLLTNYATNAISQIVPAVIGGLYWKKATVYGAAASIISGVASYLIMDAMGVHCFGFMLGIPALVINLAVFITVSLLTYRESNWEGEIRQSIFRDFFVKGSLKDR